VPLLLTPEDFFAPATLPTIGDRRKDRIHLAVGRAIHQWEYVEHHLGELFGTLLGSTVPIGALRVYGSMTGFNARQQMLFTAANALFHYRPNETLEAEFKRVVKLLDPASGRRNEFAHGLVIGEDRTDRMHYFLVPPYMSAKKRSFDATPAYTYTSKEIEGFKNKYRVLAGDVYRLRKAILDWRALWPKKLARHNPIDE
jgi:hypothetical protein